MQLHFKSIILSYFIIVSYNQLVAKEDYKIAQVPLDVQPLNIGQRIPVVTLYTSDGDPIPLRKLTYKKPTVYYFYQGYWSPICSRQLDQLEKIADQLDMMGFQLVGISPDSPYKLRRTQKKKGLKFLLLSDYHFEASRSFGVAYKLSNKEQRLARKKYGAELRNIKGEDGFTLPVPAFFIVNKQGIVQFQYVNPDTHYQLSMNFLIEATKMVASNLN